MNWQDLMPTGLSLSTGVPVLLIGTARRPGIVIDADSLHARVLLWSNGRQGADLPSKHAKLVGNVVKRGLFECKVDLDTDLGFYYALRQLIRIQEEDNTQVDLTTLRRMLTLAKEVTTDPTNEDRVALARALARIMETT